MQKQVFGWSKAIEALNAGIQAMAWIWVHKYDILSRFWMFYDISVMRLSHYLNTSP